MWHPSRDYMVDWTTVYIYQHGQCNYPQPTDYMYLLETTSEYNFLPNSIRKIKIRTARNALYKTTNTVGACRRNTSIALSTRMNY